MPAVLDGKVRGYQGQEVDFQVPLTVYPAQSTAVIVNAPGAGESQAGWRNRYATLARHLQALQVASFITYSPPLPDAQFKYPDEPYSYRDASWNQIVVESLALVVEHALEHAEEYSPTPTPTVYLAGFSAGASACAAVAYRYPQVERLLLISAYDSVGEHFYAGIRQYSGEVYMAFGSQDPMAGFLVQAMPYIAPRLRGLHARQVPDCDHGFRGETNGRVLSKAYLWAFAGDDSFPSPEGGAPLYAEGPSA